VFSLRLEPKVDNDNKLHQEELPEAVWPSQRVRLLRKNTSSVAKVAPCDNAVSLVGFSTSSSLFLAAMLRSIGKRVDVLRPRCRSSASTGVTEEARIAVLFSGGIDSVLLTALLHIYLDSVGCSDEPIDLLNVSFEDDNNITLSPDRAAAVVALGELETLFPTRLWRLVHIDVTPSERQTFEPHIRNLIKPRDTHMDLNIGSAFWFAARGIGYLQCYNKLEQERASRTSLNGRPMLRIGAAGAAAGVGRLVWEDHCIVSVQQQQPNVACDNVQVAEADQNQKKEVSSRCSQGGCRKISKRNCPHGLCKKCCLKRQGQKHEPPCSTHKLKENASLSALSDEGIIGFLDANVDDDGDQSPEVSKAKTPFHSNCKVLLVGIGADEQMAGYGRHRTTYLRDGLAGLEAEMNVDLTRLWERNLGRDDRCISDHSKEAWFPFLDEDVVSLLQSLSLEDIADLSEPPGVGDKRILRDAAKVLGLSTSSQFVKRAIQFGSRIAKLTGTSSHDSKRKVKGTTRLIT